MADEPLRVVECYNGIGGMQFALKVTQFRERENVETTTESVHIFNEGDFETFTLHVVFSENRSKQNCHLL